MGNKREKGRKIEMTRDRIGNWLVKMKYRILTWIYHSERRKAEKLCDKALFQLASFLVTYNQQVSMESLRKGMEIQHQFDNTDFIFTLSYKTKPEKKPSLDELLGVKK